MYSSSLKIRILASSPQEKGKSFELFMETILDRMSFTDFRTNIHKTGIELDIKAKHKVIDEQILCECKAHDEQIATPDLNDFYGKLSHERSKNKQLTGLFFSISGFNGTALEYYNEISDDDKRTFKIFGNKEIISFLRTAGIFTPDDKFEQKIRDNTSYTLGEKYLVYFESALYLVQLLTIGGKATNYIILTSQGDLVDKTI